MKILMDVPKRRRMTSNFRGKTNPAKTRMARKDASTWKKEREGWDSRLEFHKRSTIDIHRYGSFLMRLRKNPSTLSF